MTMSSLPDQVLFNDYSDPMLEHWYHIPSGAYSYGTRATRVAVAWDVYSNGLHHDSSTYVINNVNL